MKEIEELFSKKTEELINIFIDRMNSSFKEDVSSRFTMPLLLILKSGSTMKALVSLYINLNLYYNHDDEFLGFLDDLHDILKDEYNTGDIDQELPSFNYTL